MIKLQLIAVLFVFYALTPKNALSAQKTSFDTIKITYDVYFGDDFLGDTIALVNQEGEALAIDTRVLQEKLPFFLEKFGVSNHPAQQKKKLPDLATITDIEKSWDLVLKINPDTFRIDIHLPPQFKVIQTLSSNLNEPDSNTILPAKSRGWLSIAGNWSPYHAYQNRTIASWRGGFAIDDWHFYANGMFSPNSSQILQNWRIEKAVWRERITRLQLGWSNIPLIINGQLISPAMFGATLSNSLNRILDSAILKELPGGIFQLNENSLVEVFINGLLTRSIHLDKGRYNLRDLSIDPNLSAIDVRVTTESGRLETTRLNMISFPKQPAKGALEYVFYFGLQGDNKWAPVFGGAVYQGFGIGLAMGLHHTWMHQDGHRLGFFLEKNSKTFRSDLGGWWQTRKLDAEIGEINLNLSLPTLPFGISSRASLRFFNEHALPSQSVLEASLGFTPQIHHTDIAQISLGFLRDVSQKQGYLIRLSRTFPLWSNFNAGISINFDSIQKNTQAIFFLGLSPINGLSQQYSQDILNDQALRFTTNAYLAKEKIRFLADYAHLRSTGLNSLTLLPSLDNDLVSLRANASFQEQVKGQFGPSQVSLAFETGILFADNSFAITSRPNETFAIVDASSISHSSPLKIKLQNIPIRGFNKHFGLTGITNFKPNMIDIDASKAGYGYASRREIISPKPGQAYRILIENKDVLVATGILLFPNQEPVQSMHGKLIHTKTQENAHWYSDDDGTFVFEGKPGVWQGMVFIDDKQYHLQILLNESDSIEGALFLGNVTLQKMNP